MALDPNTIGILFTGTGLIGGATGWAVRAYVKNELGKVTGELAVHKAEDILKFEHVSEKLDDIKQDMQDLKQHFGVKSNGKPT